MVIWRLATLALAVTTVAAGTAAAQEREEDNELDRFMEQVLARRDENRIARRQYVFDEMERFTVTGYDGEVYSSFTREYVWYRRDGVFVRSPVRFDGVAAGEDDAGDLGRPQAHRTGAGGAGSGPVDRPAAGRRMAWATAASLLRCRRRPDGAGGRGGARASGPVPGERGSRLGGRAVRGEVGTGVPVGVHLDYGDYRETPATARRNAVVVRAGIERFATVGDRAPVLRPRLDARAYASAGGQAILAARLFFEWASAPLPPYERALLGGSPAARGTLRGWPAAAAVGDRIAAASIELRLPITSLLSEAQVGLRFFADTAAAYDAEGSVRQASFLEGAGVGVFVMPPGFGFSVSVDVAHDFAGGVRKHASAGFGF